MTFPPKLIVSFRIRAYYFDPATNTHCEPTHDTNLRPDDILAYLATPIFRDTIERLIEGAQTGMRQGVWFWKKPIHPHHAYIVPKTSRLVAKHEHGFTFRVGIATIRRPFQSNLKANFVVRQDISLPRITAHLNDLCHRQLLFDSYTGAQPDEGKVYQLVLDEATLHPVMEFPPQFVYSSTILAQNRDLTFDMIFKYTLPKMCPSHVTHEQYIQKKRHKLAEIKKLNMDEKWEQTLERGLAWLKTMTPTKLDDAHSEYGPIQSMSKATIKSIFASYLWLDELNHMLAPWMHMHHLPKITIMPSSIQAITFLPPLCRVEDTHMQGRVKVRIHVQLEGSIRPKLTTHTFLQNILEAINFSIQAGGWLDDDAMQEMQVDDIQFVK